MLLFANKNVNNKPEKNCVPNQSVLKMSSGHSSNRWQFSFDYYIVGIDCNFDNNITNDVFVGLVTKNTLKVWPEAGAAIVKKCVFYNRTLFYVRAQRTEEAAF